MPPESTMPISQALLSKQDQGARDRRTTGAVLLIVLPFLIQAVAYLTVLFRSVVTRNDTTYPEGVGVYAALRAWQTGHLYSDPFQFPWNYQMYGPVFYFFGYIFAKLTHGSPLLTAELMRSLSLLSFLGSAGLVSLPLLEAGRAEALGGRQRHLQFGLRMGCALLCEHESRRVIHLFHSCSL